MKFNIAFGGVSALSEAYPRPVAVRQPEGWRPFDGASRWQAMQPGSPLPSDIFILRAPSAEAEEEAKSLYDIYKDWIQSFEY